MSTRIAQKEYITKKLISDLIMSELKQIRDLKIVLKDIEPYVKNPLFLTQGKRFSNFNMLVREAWANWLLCVVFQKVYGNLFTFQEVENGDGVIMDKITKIGFVTEHVCALDFPQGKKLPKGEERVLWAINHKIKRGFEYAEGKRLVVFFDGAGIFYRNIIRENIKGKHNFDSVYCVGLMVSDKNGYQYSVTEFKDSYGDKSVTFKVEINESFTDWKVLQVMK